MQTFTILIWSSWSLPWVTVRCQKNRVVNICSLQSSAAKYVANKKLRWFQNFSVCLCDSAIRLWKICQRLSRNLCILRRQWLRHASVFYQGQWFVFLTVESTSSTWIIPFTYNTLERVKRKTLFLSLITL